ncbi:uncharacterized protein Bfra_005800 [Botrytis fragariae]|uniref:Uncharacterized protein n=1 Tax=Botrytis fragariae TaxID=1964551 RepID=A0A8H6ARH2_9HELO|nr:uncharacterized protein Bfra_005800 [Botrytis fragariae]KAF5872441.1 hypothetical protein Bfra_005800 [Botrytis fragariae]
MSAYNFNLSDQNEVQVVYIQDQEHQSDSDDMVNIGELNIELRLEITELRLENVILLVKSARLEERNNQLYIRIDEREKMYSKITRSISGCLSGCSTRINGWFARKSLNMHAIFPNILIYSKKLFAQYS